MGGGPIVTDIVKVALVPVVAHIGIRIEDWLVSETANRYAPGGSRRGVRYIPRPLYIAQRGTQIWIGCAVWVAAHTFPGFHHLGTFVGIILVGFGLLNPIRWAVDWIHRKADEGEMILEQRE